MIVRAALFASVALTAAAPAAAQDAARVDRLERSLKEVRAIVFQGRETGQPVVVKPAGPDPQVQALEKRVGDLEQTLQGVNARLDSTAHDLDEAKHALSDTRGAAAAQAEQLKALSDRVAKLEAVITPPPAPPPQAAAPGPAAAATPSPEAAPPPGSPNARRTRGAEATARAQAADTGALGGPAAATPPGPTAPVPPKTEAQAYRAARALQASGDYAGAAAAYQEYATRFPSGGHLADVRYGLGEVLFAQDNQADAARAYAQALRGWPKTVWAGDATVRLAQSLTQLNRPDQACAAIGEFETRYAAAASAAVKARAQAARARAKCPG